MLIVDPPYEWHTADDALAGLRDWEYQVRKHAHVFPARPRARQTARAFRIVCALRRCGRDAGAERRDASSLGRAARGRCGAAARVSAGVSGRRGSAQAAPASRGKHAAVGSLGGADRHQAAHARGRCGRRRRSGRASRRGAWRSSSSTVSSTARAGCRRRGPSHPEVLQIVAAQMRAFFEQLYEAGAFGARAKGDHSTWSAIGASMRPDGAHAGEFQFLIGFAALAPDGVSQLPRHAFGVGQQA